MVIDVALQANKGNIEDVDSLLKAIGNVQVEAPRCSFKFDQYRNVVQNIYVIEAKRVDNKMVNAVIETVPNVSQFWKWSPDEYLKLPQLAGLKGQWVK